MKMFRTTPENQDYRILIPLLDAELAVTDGEEHAFYDQYNKSDSIPHALVVYQNEQAVACGALKPLDPETVEIKRMYVYPGVRGQKIAADILRELEAWAAELGYQRCILETGLRQVPAIRLYEREGYLRIPNYGQYVGVANSVCFAKQLITE